MTETTDLLTNFFQVIDENGNCNDESYQPINENLLISMYESMLKSRMLDSKLVNMQRQGRIGTYAPIRGQEAAQVGSALALQKEDWIFPSYRELAACITHGLSIQQLILYFKGHFHGGKIPNNLNIFPIQIIIAGQIPQATGCAWASKLRGEDHVTLCYFGDGATSQGDFHEGLNFASVYKIPVIFFCQNNQWAISMPIEKQMASETISQKADAYGMKGIRVDGNDVLAVYLATKEAIQRARKGEGPTLIEAVTYRQGPHSTADDPTKYRNADVVNWWSNDKDPLKRFELFLEKRGLWTPSKKEKLSSDIEEEMNIAIEEAEGIDFLPTHTALDFVYDLPHQLLNEQKNELKNRFERKRGM